MRKTLNSSQKRISRIKYLKNLIKNERLAHKNPKKAGYFYYSTPLEKINESFKLKLPSQIKKHIVKNKLKNYHILDIGAGNGLTISQLEIKLSKMGIKSNFTATGISINPDWKKHSNAKKINWIKSESEILSHKIKPNSIDFAYSNFGIRYAQNIREALIEVHKILKKGGRFVFTYRGRINQFGPMMIPKGFKPVNKTLTHYIEEIDNDSTHQTQVYFIEKI